MDERDLVLPLNSFESKLWYGTIRQDTIRHSTVQYDTIWYNSKTEWVYEGRAGRNQQDALSFVINIYVCNCVYTNIYMCIYIFFPRSCLCVCKCGFSSVFWWQTHITCEEASFLAQRATFLLLKSASLNSGPAHGDLSPRSFRLLMSPLMCLWQLSQSATKVPVFQQHQRRFKSNHQNQLKQITKHTKECTQPKML